MVEVSTLVTHAWFALLLSLVATLAIFPLVFLMAFLYDFLEKKYEKAPKVLLMLITTFVGTAIAVLLIEAYLSYTLPEVLSSAIGG